MVSSKEKPWKLFIFLNEHCFNLHKYRVIKQIVSREYLETEYSCESKFGLSLLTGILLYFKYFKKGEVLSFNSTVLVKRTIIHHLNS